MIRKIDTMGHDFDLWQVDCDAYGNSRYVVHYLAIPYTNQPELDFFANQNAHIEHARRALRGKRYRAKWFGGGIVFQAYAGDPIGHVLGAIERAGVAGESQ